MNIMCALGECPSYEPWQWLYLLIVFMNFMLIVGAMIFDLYRDQRREMPHFLAFIVTPFLVVGICVPYTYPVLLVLNLELLRMVWQLNEWYYLGAPLFAAAVSIFSIAAFWYLIMGPRFWRLVNAR